MTPRPLAILLALSMGCATTRSPDAYVSRPAPYPALPPVPTAGEVPDIPDACADPLPLALGTPAPCSGILWGPQDSAEASAAWGYAADQRAMLERLRADAMAADERCVLAQMLIAERLIEQEQRTRAEWWRGLAVGGGLGLFIGVVAVGVASAVGGG